MHLSQKNTFLTVKIKLEKANTVFSGSKFGIFLVSQFLETFVFKILLGGSSSLVLLVK